MVVATTTITKYQYTTKRDAHYVNNLKDFFICTKIFALTTSRVSRFASYHAKRKTTHLDSALVGQWRAKISACISQTVCTLNK